MTQIPDTDVEFEDYVIEGVDLDRDSKPMRWLCKLQFGFQIALERRPGFQPREGQDVRVYGMLPDDVRGVVVNHRVAFYHSPEEWDVRVQERSEAWYADLRELRRTYEKEYTERFEMLPEAYRRRIERLRDADPEFRETLEVRELMISHQALMLAEVLRANEGSALDIETLRGLPTMRKMTDVVGWMLQDAKMQGSLASTHTRKSLDTMMRLARLDIEGDEEGLAGWPGAGETVQDRHLEMTDCPFPDELRM